MKGQFRIAILFTAGCMLLATMLGYSQGSAHPTKPAAKHKRLKQSTRPAVKAGSTKLHVVNRGDTLFAIARAHGTTVEALLAANNMQGSRIQIGQKLRVPVSKNLAAQVMKRGTNEVPAVQSPEPDTLVAAEVSESEGPASDSIVQPMRLQLVKAGFGLLGVRYRWRGISELSGFDCSGLVKSLFAKFNIELPRSSREQFKLGEKVDRDKLEPGDLVFFSSGGRLPTHVGIYVGDNKFLHAARKPRHVIVSDLTGQWYTSRYLGGRRMLDLWWDEVRSSELQDK